MILGVPHNQPLVKDDFGNCPRHHRCASSMFGLIPLKGPRSEHPSSQPWLAIDKWYKMITNGIPTYFLPTFTNLYPTAALAAISSPSNWLGPSSLARRVALLRWSFAALPHPAREIVRGSGCRRGAFLHHPFALGWIVFFSALWRIEFRFNIT